MGGAFNSRGFDDLGNGGFNINGSRADENTIAIDGAIGVRTRSTGTIIGIQNVDAVQEVQVLTANYMPEYGRASGGQIRFITKSGSNRYSGSGSIFYRDESLQANTWSRNRSTNPAENSGPAPFDYKQFGYAFGGPVPGNRSRTGCSFSARRSGSTSSRWTRTPRPCRPRGCGAVISASCWIRTTAFTRARSPHRSADRPAVSGQRDSGEPVVTQRPRVPEHVPGADTRVPSGNGEPDPDQRQSAKSAEGHDPP